MNKRSRTQFFIGLAGTMGSIGGSAASPSCSQILLKNAALISHQDIDGAIDNLAKLRKYRWSRCVIAKTIITFILILIAVKSEASLLCAKVLLPIGPVSLVDSEAAITEIANLRMELDLAKIEGVNNLVISAMRAGFPAKMNEINKKLSSRYSEAQIKELVAVRIKELQNLDKIEVQEDASKRAQQKKIKGGSFKMNRQIPVDDVSIGFFEYFPAIDSFIVQSHHNNELVLFNATTHSRRVLQGNNNTAIFLPKKNEVIGIDRAGKLLRFDVITGEGHSVMDTGLTDLKGKMAASPSENKLVVRTPYRASVIYLDRNQNGLVETKDVLKKLNSKQDIDFEFISENELLISTGNLLVLNLNTMQKQKIEVDHSVHEVILSPDRKLLLWKGDYTGPMGILPLSELPNFTQATLILPKDAAGAKFGKTENEVYMDLKISRGLYKFPDLETAVQLLPKDPTLDKNLYGEYPVFGTSEKMFTRQHYNDPLNQRGGTILEVWERD